MIKDFGQSYLKNLKKLLDSIDLESLEKAAEILWQAYLAKKLIFIAGNGGSASTASHMACDLSKTVRGHKGDSPWKGFKTVSLTDNVSLITAWTNDVNYESAYSGELENLGNSGDVLIAFSSSGNSENIINLVKKAGEMGLKTIGISGFGGGKLKEVSDVTLVTDSNEYGPVEDIQLILNHILVFYFFEKLSQNK